MHYPSSLFASSCLVLRWLLQSNLCWKRVDKHPLLLPVRSILRPQEDQSSHAATDAGSGESLEMSAARPQHHASGSWPDVFDTYPRAGARAIAGTGPDMTAASGRGVHVKRQQAPGVDARLFRAIVAGDKRAASRLMSEGANVYVVNPAFQMTALEAAVKPSSRQAAASPRRTTKGARRSCLRRAPSGASRHSSPSGHAGRP